MILFKKSHLGKSQHEWSRSVRGALSVAHLAALVLAAGCWNQLDSLKPTENSDAGKRGDAGAGMCPSEDMCGGKDCPPCGLGETCKLNSDCESRVCNGMCLPAGCGNKVRDEGESDTDCGGSCDPCADGKRCEQDPHCQSNVCEDGFCQEPSCEDETKNGTESDADCGGEECEACVDGKKCDGDDDCESGFCGEGTCADPSCGDKSVNGSETDLNCGGDCPPCAPGKLCAMDTDCDSRLCRENDEDVLVCARSKCDDELQNGTESDEDCGGDCDPCADGKHCTVGTDCESLVCEAVENALTCVAASCDDERANGAETGKDCGGDSDCPRCPAGEGCATHEDCATNSCEEGVCQEPSCEDGRTNQNEVATDCGGDCDACPTGTECTNGEDCRSGRCDNTCLPGGASTQCDDDDECLSGTCQSDRCSAGGSGSACYENVDCRSNNCGDSDTCGPSGLSQACATDADCVSANCDTDTDECLASDYSIQTNASNTTDQQITFEVWVERGDSDPEREWGDFAMVYFFSPPPPVNARHDFVAKYYAGPDQAVRNDNRFIARELAEGEWAMIWRATSANQTVIPASPPSSSILFQLHSQPSLNFTDEGDFSYVPGSKVTNSKVVVCQRVDGRWIHTQGQAPEFVDRPCGLVVDACPTGGDLACDVMQRTD